jgi:ArsR family transcriptional regulator, lead/cadmium/zinc/bismuth-responsive transcriptional repressor
MSNYSYTQRPLAEGGTGKENAMSDERAICQVEVIHEEAVAQARLKLVSPFTADQLAGTFKVLGDPTRVRIISALLHGELCVCDVAVLINMTQSAVSHQLRVLRTLRLVKYRKEGQVVFYSLDDQHISQLFTFALAHLEEERNHRTFLAQSESSSVAKG